MEVADCSMILRMFFANILAWIVEAFPNTVPKCKSQTPKFNGIDHVMILYENNSRLLTIH